ncbi:hypothetical protein ABVT39_022837 [Epinephelus coioides]
MSFLNPFMEQRVTSSNMPGSASQTSSRGQGDEDNAATTSQVTEPSSETESEETCTLFLEPVPPEPETPSSTPSPSPTPTATATPSTSRERSRAQKRAHDGTLSPFESQLMGAMERAVSQSTPPDPDRLFFKGLLPDLKALFARRKAVVKSKIHQLIIEATCQQADEQEG